ncbi:MAG TPA: SDR family NAD(P)-dependent oxidoreductase [Chloroflexota bacterium]|jgi:NAD(P)-dependent dehydrogenase (short-subunit alcohol dehydrogenase family)|nr:SDR family NAD(P)-dependent oxidoreductase [Chloroflexota bacterium]
MGVQESKNGRAASGAAGVTRRALQGWWRKEDLRGQVALVTGGSRGLGLLLAREYAREGCTIAICARERDELRRASADLERRGATVSAIVCDMTDPSQVKRLVEKVIGQYGRIDILANNAGIIQIGPALAMTRQDYEQAMNLMFWGVFNATQAVLPHMLERKHGHVVNITSIGGKVSVPHLLPYCCAKFAAVGYSQGLHAELARYGIKVTTIVPGLMRTGSFDQAQVKGNQKGEFLWFGPSASLPLLSMDAERAARQIVQATRRGDAERILSWPAILLNGVHGLFPGATVSVLGLVNRFLPEADGANQHRAQGKDVRERTEGPLLKVLMRLGLSAARRFNEEDR